MAPWSISELWSLVSWIYTCNHEHHALTEPGEWELFDIELDPCQKNNISGQYPEIVNKMKAHYENWWVKVEDSLRDR